jgi:ligand-binding sensor domain-containing protein
LIVCLVVLLVLCQPAGSVAAQREPPSTEPPRLIPTFQVLGRDQGLAHPTVRSILRDRRGFMWFGTNAGLNRYDGYRLTDFTASDTPSGLGVVIVAALAEDHDGVLWVGTVGAGLAAYDPRTGRFTPVQGDSP